MSLDKQIHTPAHTCKRKQAPCTQAQNERRRTMSQKIEKKNVTTTTASASAKKAPAKKTLVITKPDDLVKQDAKTEAKAETKKAEKKTEKKASAYENYTSKKNLLAVHPAMESENNMQKIFHNGFTYCITADHKYVAVTYYFSKTKSYKYACVTLDEKMQATTVEYGDSIKAAKAIIAGKYSAPATASK